MDYICKYCDSNLDGGDIYTYFLQEYGDSVKALKYASYYGWTKTDKKHFNKSIIIQPSNGSQQYTICPECKNKDPF